MLTDSLHQREMQNEGEGKRTWEKDEYEGERDYKKRMTQMSHDQIDHMSDHTCLFSKAKQKAVRD